MKRREAVREPGDRVRLARSTTAVAKDYADPVQCQALKGQQRLGAVLVRKSRCSRAAERGSRDQPSARPRRRAEDRRLVDGRRDRHRPADQAHAEARGHQQGLRDHAGGQGHPQRRRLLAVQMLMLGSRVVEVRSCLSHSRDLRRWKGRRRRPPLRSRLPSEP